MLELVPSLEGNGSISSAYQYELSNGNSIIVWDQHDQNAVSVHGHTGANFTYARVIDAVAGEFVSEQITLIDGTLSRAYMDKNSFVELSNGGFAFNTSQNDPQTGQMIYESLSVDMDFDVNYLQTSLGLPPVQGAYYQYVFSQLDSRQMIQL